MSAEIVHFTGRPVEDEVRQMVRSKLNEQLVESLEIETLIRLQVETFSLTQMLCKSQSGDAMSRLKAWHRQCVEMQNDIYREIVRRQKS